MRRFLQAVAALLAGWWRADRIRVPAGASRLLWLTPPCVTVIDGRSVEVLARRLEETPAGPCVTYDCRTAAGPARLHVYPDRRRPTWELSLER